MKWELIHVFLQKVDVHGNTSLHQAVSNNSPGSAEVAQLLISAGVELDVKNKQGRSAVDECVAANNMEAMKVLVTAGANLQETVRLARASGREETVTSPQSRQGGAAALSVQDEKEDLLRRLGELLEKETQEIEVKRMEKKKLLDKTKANLQSHSKKMEEEIAIVEKKCQDLKSELSRFKKEEEKKIKALALEVSELGCEFDRKAVGRVKSEDVAKCLECPVCLDLCKPPKEVSLSHRYQFDTHLMNMLDLAVP